MTLTRSPEPLVTLAADTSALLIATVAVVGLAGLTIAAHLHTRWAGLRRLPLLGLHLVISMITVLGAVVPLGILVLAPAWGSGFWGVAGGVLLGPAVGYAVIRLDRAITGWWGRGYGHAVRDNRSVALRSGHARPAGVAAGSTGGQARRTGLTEARNDFAPTSADLQVRLPLLLGVAAAEEVVHRGVLLALALRVPSPVLAGFAVLGVQLVFALSHVFFGWGQVLSKLPLAALCTVAVLVTGTVVPAVIGHLIFNAWVWRYHRAAPKVTNRRSASSAWGVRR
ncbi:MAG TPA: CPBP family intramembrane glutamic endopeptidase [Actinophytocola sp.]|uniref:CPBP family intramembrane glutamic endopeptidase n=1 Tax=Actinophytocola sp. TaxID=1872138 RepID=UPI002DFF992C|nr:CPBP family intramembrane glutamic endopeptidase [Actinophytocola sp.]